MCNKIFLKTGLAFMAVILSLNIAQAQNRLHKARVWPAPDHTRIVFELKGPVEHKVFSLANPNRLVIDIDKISLTTKLQKLSLEQTPIANIRYATKKGGDLRIVLDLSKKINARSFLLRPNNTYGYRLVVDLVLTEKVKMQKKAPPTKKNLRNILIAIDPGHGGDDTGAIGHKGTKEKNVVLSISKKLNTLLKNKENLDAIMTRTGDYYVKLPDRVDIARKQRADLLVSIHADAYKNSKPKGASVFALSPGRATSEMASWLADSENKADLLGGAEGVLSLDDKDETLQGVLLDLSMTATLTESLKVGNKMLASIKNVNVLHKKTVEQAGFVVLKAPDIPSILVETGFISNYAEERKLRSSSYQYKMAKAILNGIVNYFKANPPLNTHLSVNNKNHYKVQSGDTLSSIARKKNISLSKLKSINSIENDRLYAGQILHIY